MKDVPSRSFSEFGLNPILLTTLETIGFVHPSSIQEESIPIVLDGKDLVAKAKTGSGKTAAFSLPILHLLSEDESKQALILTPTRELAAQVAEEMNRLSKGIQIQAVAIYGGESITQQIKRIKQGVRIIIATPGRLLDLLKSNHMKDFDPSIIVLDEADEMLNMGFIDDIETILSYFPTERQTLLFSATMPKPIENLTKKFLNSPVVCGSTPQASSRQDIEQLFYLTAHNRRNESLVELMQYHAPKKSIVFCKMKSQVDDLAKELSQGGLNAFRLHGDMMQKERQQAIEAFKEAKEGCLVATDIAGRGINILDITHVFNYELPHSVEGYTHRIGRTARAGNSGVAITLLTNKELQWVKKLFKKEVTIDIATYPTEEVLQQKKIDTLVSSMKNQDVSDDAAILLSQLTNEISLEEIALHFLTKICTKPKPVSDQVTKKRDSFTKSRPAFGEKKEFFRKSKPAFGEKKESFSKPKSLFGDKKESFSKPKSLFGEKKDRGDFRSKPNSNFDPKKKKKPFGSKSTAARKSSYAKYNHN